MLSTLETTILKGLIHDDAYTRKVLPYLKESYFDSTVGKTYYRICQEYFSELSLQRAFFRVMDWRSKIEVSNASGLIGWMGVMIRKIAGGNADALLAT